MNYSHISELPARALVHNFNLSMYCFQEQLLDSAVQVIAYTKGNAYLMGMIQAYPLHAQCSSGSSGAFPARMIRLCACIEQAASQVKNPKKRFPEGRDGSTLETLLDIFLPAPCSCRQPQLLCLSRFFHLASRSDWFYLTLV